MRRKILCALMLTLFLVVFMWSGAWAASQQTSGVTAGGIMEDVRSAYLNATSPSGVTDVFYPDTDLLTYINLGVIDIVSRSLCLQTTESITLQTGTSAYTISTNYIAVESVINNADSGVTNRAYRLGNLQSIGNSDAEYGTESRVPVYWVDWGGQIILYPEPESGVSGNVCTVYLYQRPVALSSTSTIPTPAIYDMALIYFVTCQALKKAEKFNDAKVYEEFYLAEMERLKAYFNKPQKEGEVITK